jgi:hypothetical protein
MEKEPRGGGDSAGGHMEARGEEGGPSWRQAGGVTGSRQLWVRLGGWCGIAHGVSEQGRRGC